VIYRSSRLAAVRANIAAQNAKILNCRVIHGRGRATDQPAGGLFVPILDTVTALILKHGLPVLSSILTGIQFAVVALESNTRLLV
jgi:hypothetical protein